MWQGATSMSKWAHITWTHARRGVRGRRPNFSSSPGTLITAESGCRKTWRAGMWIKQHGGKKLGLLASRCFLLISHLVVLHVQLTTAPRLLPSTEMSVYDSEEAYLSAVRGRKYPPAEQTEVPLQVLWTFKSYFLIFSKWQVQFLRI